ncbi:peptidoglycan -binding protein [Sedimentitalea sp. HM32M-2]|uniref:peptidoglycan -binding protein n=1 Tax=Sedimentitalea sp. HM32M-2 TaxID=3351566 RepID=UPI00363177DC
MALTRRSGTRFQASIWPGFVDAMTGLLLVLMFLLTIFMVVQFVLRETISGQESELDTLSAEVDALARALGLEERQRRQLETRMGELNSTLNQARDDLAEQTTAINTLTAQRDRQAQALQAAQTQITAFEAQVAGLLAERDQALRELAASGTEREALQTLLAELRQRDKDNTARLNQAQQALNDREAARLTEAAAAEALRARLRDADAELTAMTLALEAQRKAAEDTLTLLAAAEVARDRLDDELADALTRLDAAQAETGTRDALVDQLTRTLDQMRRDQTDLDRALQEARANSAATETELRAELAQARSDRTNLQAQLESARADLKTLQQNARVSSDERATAEDRLLQALEALERAQVAASDRDLLQARLTAALTARQQAESAASQRLTLAEQRAALLAQAKAALAEEKEISTETRRQTALLNQQIAALRAQLGGLQALLDDYKQRDAAAQVQLEALGADLNAALARAASEERKRRLLEETERKRLAEEARKLAATARELQAQAQDLQRYRSEFFGRLRAVLGNREGVRIEGDRFVFSSEVLFPPGRAELSAAGRAEIAKVAAILRDVAADIPPELDWVIRVDGHTDDTPMIGSRRYRDNWELSQGRALSVVRYMVEALDIPPQRLAANGFGQYQPVNPANTPQARAQNRRIELKLTEK